MALTSNIEIRPRQLHLRQTRLTGYRGSRYNPLTKDNEHERLITKETKWPWIEFAVGSSLIFLGIVLIIIGVSINTRSIGEEIGAHNAISPVSYVGIVFIVAGVTLLVVFGVHYSRIKKKLQQQRMEECARLGIRPPSQYTVIGGEWLAMQQAQSYENQGYVEDNYHATTMIENQQQSESQTSDLGSSPTNSYSTTPNATSPSMKITTHNTAYVHPPIRPAQNEPISVTNTSSLAISKTVVPKSNEKQYLPTQKDRPPIQMQQKHPLSAARCSPRIYVNTKQDSPNGYARPDPPNDYATNIRQDPMNRYTKQELPNKYANEMRRDPPNINTAGQVPPNKYANASQDPINRNTNARQDPPNKYANARQDPPNKYANASQDPINRNTNARQDPRNKYVDATTPNIRQDPLSSGYAHDRQDPTTNRYAHANQHSPSIGSTPNTRQDPLLSGNADANMESRQTPPSHYLNSRQNLSTRKDLRNSYDDMRQIDPNSYDNLRNASAKMDSKKYGNTKTAAIRNSDNSKTPPTHGSLYVDNGRSSGGYANPIQIDHAGGMIDKYPPRTQQNLSETRQASYDNRIKSFQTVSRESTHNSPNSTSGYHTPSSDKQFVGSSIQLHTEDGQQNSMSPNRLPTNRSNQNIPTETKTYSIQNYPHNQQRASNYPTKQQPTSSTHLYRSSQI